MQFKFYLKLKHGEIDAWGPSLKLCVTDLTSMLTNLMEYISMVNAWYGK